jgi:hypothetical protein
MRADKAGCRANLQTVERSAQEIDEIMSQVESSPFSMTSSLPRTDGDGISETMSDAPSILPEDSSSQIFRSFDGEKVTLEPVFTWLVFR